jgi:hypothetical protein
MPYKLGQYSISVSLNGTPIKNSPFHVRFEKRAFRSFDFCFVLFCFVFWTHVFVVIIIQKQKTAIFSRNCRAAFKGDSGSGVITAGKEATLIIQSRDINNRPITVGGAEPGFRVCVYLPSAKESTVMSSNPSFYFNPARQGLSDKGLTDVYGTAHAQPHMQDRTRHDTRTTSKANGERRVVRDNKDGTYTATFALSIGGLFGGRRAPRDLGQDAAPHLRLALPHRLLPRRRPRTQMRGRRHLPPSTRACCLCCVCAVERVRVRWSDEACAVVRVARVQATGWCRR